ncbi:hypothetical protein TMUPMC115_0174 [Tetragenococcus muriaticus PMC-11-5]|uniref:Uncharacterized protein n=1 Tax=Tetragenococcus muriaticus PMC-11-5 TaxID=1302649 RepID=A0A091CAG5_9ENTE|nr:hypothetical protein TMUPMC115_0174 [Tetragenococcus muriaticus PMC-11-5]
MKNPIWKRNANSFPTNQGRKEGLFMANLMSRNNDLMDMRDGFFR